ncbi:MAG: glycosyltransferase family 2 protein, partial [bacterium]
EHSQNLPTDSISFCDWKVLNLADNQLIQYLTHTNWNDQNDILPRLATGYIQTSAPLHPRKLLIATGGFDETLPAYQEYDLHLRMACLGFDFVNLPKILYQVHKRSDSVGSNKLRQWRQQNRVIQRACKILQDKGALTYERKTAMAEALIAGARRLMTKGAMSCAWRNFKDACQIHPKGSIPCLRRLVYLLLLNSCSPTVRKCGSRLKQALRS